MPRFTLTQNRKPWNAVAGWLYKEAEYLVNNAESLGLMHVEEIKKKLENKLSIWVSRDGTSLIRKIADGIEISTWYGSDRWILGINKKNSTDGSALTVKNNEPEPQEMQSLSKWDSVPGDENTHIHLPPYYEQPPSHD